MEKEELEQAWIDYKIGGSIDQRNVLVVHYSSLTRYVASRVGAGMPTTVDRDDLISYGHFGLIDAIDRFDPERGVKFETYAMTRIRGEIIDQIRKLDWVPRSVRAKARDVQKAESALELKLERKPTDEELAEEMGLTLPELWAAQSEGNIATVSAMEEYEDSEDRQGIGQKLYDPASNPEDIVVKDAVAELVAGAISRLSVRSKTIMTLYYLEGFTLSEIGEVLGVTESRVCQLQGRLLHDLREGFGQGRLAP